MWPAGAYVDDAVAKLVSFDSKLKLFKQKVQGTILIHK